MNIVIKNILKFNSNCFPLLGEPGTDIALELLPSEEDPEAPAELFALVGKQVRLTAPLDRDARDLSSIMFQVIKSLSNYIVKL